MILGTLGAIIVLVISIAVLLIVGTYILGGDTLECGALPGNATHGWQGRCNSASETSTDGYAMVTIVVIIAAAAAILFVLRLAA